MVDKPNFIRLRQKAMLFSGDELEEKADASADLYDFRNKFSGRITRRSQT
jgi:hypothetical protein